MSPNGVGGGDLPSVQGVDAASAAAATANGDDSQMRAQGGAPAQPQAVAPPLPQSMGVPGMTFADESDPNSLAQWIDQLDDSLPM